MSPRPERADAARNRAKILAAAGEIVLARGVEALAMADVAAAAGVGVGTLYRRFGDRSGLAYALIDEREREFQASFIEGPPPLGPGAPAPPASGRSCTPWSTAPWRSSTCCSWRRPRARWPGSAGPTISTMPTWCG
ncbi:TetR family transcriptional regulator [Nonomuraea antimicrobica]